MAITVGGTSITFNDATTQSTAGITSAVTSAVAGNGITVSSSTGSVTFSQDYYNGNSATATSYPIGSYLTYTTNAGFVPNNGFNQSVPYAWIITVNPPQSFTGSNTSSNPGIYYSALSGTWKNRGQTSGTDQLWIFQRVA